MKIDMVYMVIYRKLLWALAAVLAIGLILVNIGCRSEDTSPKSSAKNQMDERAIMVTIVYDNNPGRNDLTPAWGFACVVQGFEKTILFDTGGDGRILLENMQRLDLDPMRIDMVVLSHIHGDHTGGLMPFMRLWGGLPVYMPTGFPESFKEKILSLGGQPIEATETVELCPGVRTTGTLGQGVIEEQGLCFGTADGWVVITGRAHPGVANMAAQAKQITQGPIHMVIGGFHMSWASKQKINAVINRFEEMGIEWAGPCRCSGDTTREIFKERLSKHCVLAGVGSVFHFPCGKS